MSTYTVSAARAKLPAILDDVAEGEDVTITRHGAPVAVVVRPDRVRARRPAAEKAIEEARKVGEMIREAGKRPFKRTLDPQFAEDLVASIRAERDEDVWTRLTQTS